MVNAPNHCILDLVIARMQLDEGARDVVRSKCFFGNPFVELPVDGLAADLSELDQPPIRDWLMDLGREKGPGYPWIRERVAPRTFSIWALLEFARFMCAPLDDKAKQRLVAASSSDSRFREELSMPFVKATWLGYFHLVDRALAHRGVMWPEIPRELYPTLRNYLGDVEQPVGQWPMDYAAWAGFADVHGSRGFRLDDDRLRIRQLVSLAGPARSGNTSRLDALGRSIVNPAMQSLRPIKDGHKGVGRTLPVLANLIAACAGDRLIMNWLGPSARSEWILKLTGETNVRPQPHA